MSTNLNPTQLLGLITSVFNGESVNTNEPIYQFSDTFFPDTVLKDEETYLELKHFEFDVKYDFFLSFTRKIIDIIGMSPTMCDKDAFVDNYYNHLKSIVRNPQSRLRVIKENDQIVSLVLGSYLPITRARTSYDSWGIAEDSDSYIEFNLANTPSTYDLTREKHDEGVIVVSKNYLRVGPMELCGDQYRLLLNTRNAALFTSDNTTQATKKLLDVVLACQAAKPQILGLFDRVDQTSDKGGRYVSSTQKKSYLVFADLQAFAETQGYVMIPITTDEDSLGRKIAPLQRDSNSDLLYKDVSIVEKAKLVKSDRYALIGECGPLFAIEKTSKNTEIRKKTENTKTFRADLCNSLLYQFTNLILGDELNAQNLLPHHKYEPIHADEYSEYSRYSWKSYAPPAIISAGAPALNSWLLGQLDAAHSAMEAGYKQNVWNHAESVFKTNSRDNFFSTLSKFLPATYTQNRNTPSDLNRFGMYLLNSRNAHLVSFNDKSTVSLPFKQVLNIYNLPERSSGRSFSGSVTINHASQLVSFYLDNFIPQQATEEALNKLTDSQFSSRWGSSDKCMQLYNVPDSDILIEEVVSLSSESVQLIKSMAAVRTYSSLSAWWTFAKQHLETTTIPSLRLKSTYRGPDYITLMDLNFKSFTRYIDWTLETLEKAEATFLTSEES